METVATYGWRQGRTVRAGLREEPERFGFFQAVRLLEILNPGKVPVGEGVDPEAEVARFRSRTKLDFPASEIETLETESPGPPKLGVSFLGLAGALGPLPPPITELLRERVMAGDQAMADFLDIFNHRLISLFYRAKKKYLPPMRQEAPDRGRVGHCLYSLIGLGTPGLLGRMGFPDRSLLYYTGLMTGPRRSMVGLERLLSGFFGVPAQVEPFQGAWYDLAEDQHTRIGKTGSNQALGLGAMLGQRVWDQQAGFEVRLGPLGRRQLHSLLPIEEGFTKLRSLTRFYVGEELDFHFRITVKAEEIPPLVLGSAGETRLGWSARLSSGGDGQGSQPRLGHAGGSRLGWTSWLRSRPPKADDSQLRLEGRT